MAHWQHTPTSDERWEFRRIWSGEVCVKCVRNDAIVASTTIPPEVWREIALDLGRELERAEAALRLSLPYAQDRPLRTE